MKPAFLILTLFLTFSAQASFEDHETVDDLDYDQRYVYGEARRYTLKCLDEDQKKLSFFVEETMIPEAYDDQGDEYVYTYDLAYGLLDFSTDSFVYLEYDFVDDEDPITRKMHKAFELRIKGEYKDLFFELQLLSGDVSDHLQIIDNPFSGEFSDFAMTGVFTLSTQNLLISSQNLSCDLSYEFEEDVFH